MRVFLTSLVVATCLAGCTAVCAPSVGGAPAEASASSPAAPSSAKAPASDTAIAGPEKATQHIGVRLDVRTISSTGYPTEHIWDVVTKDGKDVFIDARRDNGPMGMSWAIGNPHVDGDGRIELNLSAATSEPLILKQPDTRLPILSAGYQSAVIALRLKQGVPTHLDVLGMDVAVLARVLPEFVPTLSDDHARANR